MHLPTYKYIQEATPFNTVSVSWATGFNSSACWKPAVDMYLEKLET